MLLWTYFRTPENTIAVRIWVGGDLTVGSTLVQWLTKFSNVGFRAPENFQTQLRESRLPAELRQVWTPEISILAPKNGDLSWEHYFQFFKGLNCICSSPINTYQGLLLHSFPLVQFTRDLIRHLYYSFPFSFSAGVRAEGIRVLYTGASCGGD